MYEPKKEALRVLYDCMVNRKAEGERRKKLEKLIEERLFSMHRHTEPHPDWAEIATLTLLVLIERKSS